MPYPLEVPIAGTAAEQRAQPTDEVYRELAHRGLVAGNPVEAELEKLLRHRLTSVFLGDPTLLKGP
jgi:hypothetical protein